MSLDISKVKTSFEDLKPISDEVSLFFFETLFFNYPASNVIFKNSDMEKQKKSLITSLVKIVDGLDDLDLLGEFLRDLGGQHLSYRVKEEHYQMVGKCLITTLRHFLKEKWTPDLEDQWILTIGFMADQMLTGAKQVEKRAEKFNPQPLLNQQLPEFQDLSQMVRQIARGILYKALEDETDGEFMRAARKKAANILTQAIRDESAQLQMNFDASKGKAF